MIKLLDDIYLDADDQCFMLKFWNGRMKPGKTQELPSLDGIKFYSKMDDLLQALFKILQRRNVQSSASINELNSKNAETVKFIRQIGNSIQSAYIVP